MNDNKGQAAIEFLVTYGWAILAAMLVIAALTYFGITNPSLPDKCLFSNAFECNDYLITAGNTKVKLTNSLGQTIYGNLPDNISAVLTDNPASSCIVNTSATNAVTDLEPEAIIEVTCNNPVGAFDVGDKARVKITVTYAKNPSGYNQVSLGEVYATVQ